MRQRSTVMEVMLGLLVGLLTMLLGLPTFLMWAYRHHIGSTWALPLTLFGGLVLSMLVAALSVRRHLPGVFPGLLAGVVGALIILGIVAFYLFF